MTADHKTSYTADGPTDVGFRTGGDETEIANGVFATGIVIGVQGKSVGRPDPDTNRPLSDFIGVVGESNVGSGVFGDSLLGGGNGVSGKSIHGTGVAGVGKTGVSGLGDGRGEDVDLTGVHGKCINNPRNFTGSGVFGENDQGAGVQGASNISTGVWGHSESGWGVHGSSAGSYGGVFASKNFAQIRLEPADSLGPPTWGPHLKGEFFVDRTGALFYCYGGDPPRWEKLAGPSLFRSFSDSIVAVINRLRDLFGP